MCNNYFFFIIFLNAFFFWRATVINLTRKHFKAVFLWHAPEIYFFLYRPHFQLVFFLFSVILAHYLGICLLISQTKNLYMLFHHRYFILYSNKINSILFLEMFPHVKDLYSRFIAFFYNSSYIYLMFIRVLSLLSVY